MADSTAADGGVSPEKHFVHPHTAHHVSTFFFYAYGNTPPTDLLQHVPPDASRADVLSLGCGDLRDILYSILLHGGHALDRGRTPRLLSFTQNDWEPAIHARNIILLQMILDSRKLGKKQPDAVDDIKLTMNVVEFGSENNARADACDEAPKQQRLKKKTSQKKRGSKKKGSQPKMSQKRVSDSNEAVFEESPDALSFAQRIGAIFSAMYNVFVDADVLGTIHHVARKLAASTSSSEEWASTELGKIVRFADDRSRERVREILSHYTDESLQGKRFAARVRGERSSFIAKFVTGTDVIRSRTLGLASCREGECWGAYAEMRSVYLKNGTLDPFPLLRTEEKSRQQRGPCNLVNPLLLVTERKGRAYCLHYGAFPLDAFHTDVVWWKLQPERLQEEYGKIAPRVTEHLEVNSFIGKDGPTTTPIPQRVIQDAWLCAALEEFAQMCAAFLRATDTAATVPASTTAPGLKMNIQTGDALNFCDALVTLPDVRESRAESGSHNGGSGSGHPAAGFTPVAFQQGSLQPLHLHPDVFSGDRPEFNVISTSNLAEHLGLVNLLVATVPLLKRMPHAVLLTSLLAALGELDTYRSTVDFYKKIMCMTPQTASILLGVVPASSLSSVASEADTLARFSIESPKWLDSSDYPVGAGAGGGRLRLPWKHATPTFTEASASGILVDICPATFVDLTLPIYKAMMSHITTVETLMSGPIAMSENLDVRRALSTPNHYTPASFGRLLALASRRLRLTTSHFEAALDATIHCSGLILASNLAQEQVALFQTLKLAPIHQSYGGCMRSIPLDTRRVVLLVPQSGVRLLRAFVAPEVFLSITDKSRVFDNHFVSIHMAYVRVRRGSGDYIAEDTSDQWRSLNSHLAVRDAREDDPEAELMVSAVVPTFGLLVLPPSMVELQLCPRDTHEIFAAPKDVKKGLGMETFTCPVFFKADLADHDRTAVLKPGPPRPSDKSNFSKQLPVPAEGLGGALDKASHKNGANNERGSYGQHYYSSSRHDNVAVDLSIELVRRGSAKSGSQLVCTVTLTMANDLSRQRLNSASPALEATLDRHSVRVTLGVGFSHTVHLPFPLKWGGIRLKFSKREGVVILTVPPIDRPFHLPVTRTTGITNDDSSCGPAVPSSLFWTPSAPLRSLPKLDFNAEWAHKMVFGVMSIHLLERSLQRKGTTSGIRGANMTIVELKKSFLHIATTTCKNHSENRPGWKHPWICITEGGDRDKRAIWIWVNDILLDSSNEALMLDCCILPIDCMVDAVSTRVEVAVAQERCQGGTGVSFIKASTEEVDLWESLIPVAVERARLTYAHTAGCSYNQLSDVRPTLCTCGKGEDLPKTFKLPARTGSAVGEAPPLHPLMYRAALSPLYAPTEMACLPPVREVSRGANDSRSSVKCAKCGKGGQMMKCARCHAVSYCSKECQRKDWKRHKPSCG